MKSLIVEGWRGINQSYAMVNQFQLRELRQHDLTLYHRDVPFFDPKWSLEKSDHGFRADFYDEIARIPLPPDDFEPDVTYRIFWPLRFTEARSKRVFVFGTSEFQNLQQVIPPDQLEQALIKEDLTIVTSSQWSAGGFRRAGFDESKILVIPLGIDPTVFKPPAPESRAQFRRSLNFNDEDFVLLSVGAMTYNKGIEDLLIAYAIVSQTYGNVRLVLKDQRTLYNISAKEIVDKMKVRLPQLVDDALAESIVYISHSLSVEELAALYGAADCYVSPYLAEGFNLPPLEAAACGAPIVVTRGGATDDYVDESFALLIDSELQSDADKRWLKPDIESLVEQLSTLIEKRADRIDMARAVELIGRKFSWRAVVNQLVDAMFA